MKHWMIEGGQPVTNVPHRFAFGFSRADPRRAEKGLNPFLREIHAVDIHRCARDPGRRNETRMRMFHNDATGSEGPTLDSFGPREHLRPRSFL